MPTKRKSALQAMQEEEDARVFASMESSMPMSWDEYFMTMAFFISMKSKDTSTRIGAVIVAPDHEIVATGFNGLCRGVNDHESLTDRHDRSKYKYLYYEHAERNAVFHAARLEAHVKGCSMYTQGTPCCDCSRAIIQAGIKEVIVSALWEQMDNMTEARKKWADQAVQSKLMFKEAGVKLRVFKGPYSHSVITGTFSGKTFELRDAK